jgi:hypothetical protein
MYSFIKEAGKRVGNLWQRFFHNSVLRLGLYWIFALLLCLIFLSALINSEIEKNFPPQAMTDIPLAISDTQAQNTWQKLSPYLFGRVPVYLIYVTFFCALLAGILGGRFFKEKYPTRGTSDSIFSVYWNPVTRHDFASATATTLVITVIWVFVLIAFIDKPNWIKVAIVVLTNPGGIFALITGAATLIGTYIAVHSILEMKHTITSFPQLMERVTHLINDKSKDPDMGVLYLAFTPLPGSWNAGSRTAKNLKNALGDPDNKIRVACLKLGDDEDHTKFLNLFKDKEMPSGKVSQEVINEYHAECVNIASVLKGSEYDNLTGKKKAAKYLSALHELEDAKMPGYYFFVSSERAIVAIPVGMPTLKHPTITGNAVNVQTLGFETTDRQIIDMLQKEFERYTETKL